MKVNVSNRGLNLPERSTAPPISGDFEGNIADAQRQLEFLQSKRHELEQQKLELEELNERKQDFLNGQLDITEKLSGTLTSIEREVFEMRQEIQDMEQTRDSFAAHLKRIQAINPESWAKAKLREELEKAILTVDRAEDEYEQAAAYFSGARGGGIFGRNGGRRSHSGQDFGQQLRSGLAFNLPVIILGALALLTYIAKS